MNDSNEPTTKAERGGMLLTLEQLGYEGGRLSDETMRDFTRRLIADVDRLEVGWAEWKTFKERFYDCSSCGSIFGTCERHTKAYFAVLGDKP